MIHAKIFNADDFSELIYGSGGLPKINNLDKTIKYFDYRDLIQLHLLNGKMLYFAVLFDDKNIIGISKLLESNIKNTYWVQYFSIKKEYQSKGYSRILLDCVFKWASTNNYTLETSGYSNIGFNTLKRLFKEYSAKYNVNFIDNRTEPQYESIIIKFKDFIL